MNTIQNYGMTNYYSLGFCGGKRNINKIANTTCDEIQKTVEKIDLLTSALNKIKTMYVEGRMTARDFAEKTEFLLKESFCMEKPNSAYHELSAYNELLAQIPNISKEEFNAKKQAIFGVIKPMM